MKAELFAKHFLRYLPQGEQLAAQNLALLQKEPPSSMQLVLDTDFPDPTVIQASDGMFYAYATETVRDGSRIRLQGARSEDGVEWELLPYDLLPYVQDWSTGEMLWAPFVREDVKRGEFFVYFGIETRDRYGEKGHQAVTVARSTDPAKPFVHESAKEITWAFREGKHMHNDTFVYQKPDGQLSMVWGSAGFHIMEKPLNEDGTAFEDPISCPQYVLDALPGDPYERKPEGVFLDVTQQGELVPAYWSGSDPFGNGLWDESWLDKNLKPGEYAVLVGMYDMRTGKITRRTEIDSTYKNNVLVDGNRRFKNPGNNSVVVIDGRKYAYMHAIDRDNPYFPGTMYNRRPMIRVELGEDQHGLPIVVDTNTDNVIELPYRQTVYESSIAHASD